MKLDDYWCKFKKLVGAVFFAFILLGLCGLMLFGSAMVEYETQSAMHELEFSKESIGNGFYYPLYMKNTSKIFERVIPDATPIALKLRVVKTYSKNPESYLCVDYEYMKVIVSASNKDMDKYFGHFEIGESYLLCGYLNGDIFFPEYKKLLMDGVLKW
jgi:hypothetical protein